MAVSTTLGDLRMFIGGRWVGARSTDRAEVRSPVTGDVIATIPEGARQDAITAIEAAQGARRRWAATPLKDRARISRRIAEVVRRRRDELAHLLSLEQGKPYQSEARDEAGAISIWFEMAAEYAMTLETAMLPIDNPVKRVFTIRQPRGVYAVVTPWNFPLGIPSQYISAALVTGNVVVWVPAPTTSACAVKLAECLDEAEVPPGVVNLVTGQGPVVGDEIVANPGTDAVAFTGSSATGRTIAARAAGKPLLLELGGDGPTIVFSDADLERAAPAIAWGCYRNAGQICSATGRILVHESVRQELTERLVAAAAKVRLGDPFDPQTTMGPLNNERTATKVDEHLADAAQRGAQIRFGGRRAEGFPTNLYYFPTVADGVSLESRLHLEETFGPVAALVTFHDDDEAFRFADASALGLAGSVYTRDLARGLRTAERLRLGTVIINDQSSYWDRRSPSGGASGKFSGIGRLGGRYSLLEMTDLKTIVLDIG